MAEPRELFRLLDAAGRQLTFPESMLPHEASRRLLDFLGVKIVKTNEQIDADLQARFGERELTVRCQPCEWSFTGPTTTAIAEQRTHSESAAHGRKLLELVDRGDTIRPKPRGETMGEKTCEACGFEQAPTHGRYAGIGVACRRKGFYRKDGQIHPPAGGTPPSEAPSEPEAAVEPEPEPVPGPEAPPPSEPASEPEAGASFAYRAERLIAAALKVDELQAMMGALNDELGEAIAEHNKAAAGFLPEA